MMYLGAKEATERDGPIVAILVDMSEVCSRQAKNPLVSIHVQCCKTGIEKK